MPDIGVALTARVRVVLRPDETPEDARKRLQAVIERWYGHGACDESVTAEVVVESVNDGA